MWDEWNSTNSTTMTASTSSGNTIRLYDSTDTTTTATYSSWTYVHDDSTDNSNWNSGVRYRRPTEDENREFLEREAERERERLAEYEQDQERVAARKKAERLLKKMLTATQRRDWQRHRWFYVTGESGKRYRIRGDTLIANIDEVGPDKQPVRRLCAHPMDDIPLCDSILAQKLMIEADEQGFLRIANVHPLMAA